MSNSSIPGVWYNPVTREKITVRDVSYDSATYEDATGNIRPLTELEGCIKTDTSNGSDSEWDTYIDPIPEPIQQKTSPTNDHDGTFADSILNRVFKEDSVISYSRPKISLTAGTAKTISILVDRIHIDIDDIVRWIVDNRISIPDVRKQLEQDVRELLMKM